MNKKERHIPDEAATGFEKVMKIMRLLDNPYFGDYLDECEDKQTVKLKVTSSGVVFRSGTLKIIIPIEAAIVQFPTCVACGKFYLGHHRGYCPSCEKRIGCKNIHYNNLQRLNRGK